MSSLQNVHLIAAMLCTTWLAGSAGAADGALEGQDSQQQQQQAPQERKFRFVYHATITELEPGAAARVWIPIATTNEDQDVELIGADIPFEYKRTKERKFGNELLYFEGKANEQGEIPLKVEYVVTRRALVPQGSPATQLRKEQFLAGSTKVPVDGSVLKRFFSDSEPMGTTVQIARELYDRVDLHMKYDKSGEGWGQGDAVWACDSKRGNCSDFHSVFIALCRDLQIPAKFEIGFPLPAEKGKGDIAGYHCWAKFLDGDRWIGVDISEADKHPELKDLLFGNLPPDRVMFSTERDLLLEPRQASGPVNFLVYPYVEVKGKVHSKQTRSFRFEDL